MQILEADLTRANQAQSEAEAMLAAAEEKHTSWSGRIYEEITRKKESIRLEATANTHISAPHHLLLTRSRR